MKRVAGALLTSLVSVCACQKAADTQPAATPVATGLKGLVADATAFMEHVRTEQDAAIGAIGQLEYVAARKLLSVSGVEQELGGPPATDAALRGLMLKMKQVIAERQPPRWIPVQSSQTVDGALGVAQASVELMTVSLGFKELYGEGEAGKRTGNSGEGVFEIEIADGALSYTSALTTSEGGLNGKFLTRMKVNVCPDAAGKITLEMSSKASMSRAGGSGANTTIEAVVTRTLDDDAQTRSAASARPR